MYSTIYSTIVRGAARGFRCPVSGREFLAVNPARTQLETLFQKQQAYSSELYYEQDGGQPILRSVESRRLQFVAEHGEPI